MNASRSLEQWRERKGVKFNFGEWDDEERWREPILKYPRKWSRRVMEVKGGWAIPWEEDEGKWTYVKGVRVDEEEVRRLNGVLDAKEEEVVAARQAIKERDQTIHEKRKTIEENRKTMKEMRMTMAKMEEENKQLRLQVQGEEEETEEEEEKEVEEEVEEKKGGDGAEAETPMGGAGCETNPRERVKRRNSITKFEEDGAEKTTKPDGSVHRFASLHRATRSAFLYVASALLAA
ncbi:hypothetical protein TrRE_jg571 [Triparma retinervis]|uniref:Uncharacterized protein n=1 Tax=Triparma retinervis TaxID=2557542 RepID=A0A9W7DPR4_9STRA|nr:hypothetical protein TrRE_jg571 [Triparma retinervis]